MKMLVFVTVGLLTACHQEKRQDIQLDQTTKAVKAEDSQAETHETKSQGPSDITLKTEREDDNAVIVEEADGSIVIAKVPAKKPLRLPKGSRVTGTVDLGGGVKTEQEKKLGAVDDTIDTETKKKTAETDTTDTKLKAHLDEITDTGPGWEFYAACIGGLIVILAAGYFYLKMVKKVSWL